MQLCFLNLGLWLAVRRDLWPGVRPIFSRMQSGLGLGGYKEGSVVEDLKGRCGDLGGRVERVLLLRCA